MNNKDEVERQAFEQELISWWPQAKGNLAFEDGEYLNHFMNYAWWAGRPAQSRRSIMTEELCRVKFEEWVAERFGDVVDRRRARNGDQGYMAWDMIVAWEAWLASRAAIEIELPEKVMVEDEYDRGHNYGIEYCEEAIHKAGIRTTEKP